LKPWETGCEPVRASSFSFTNQILTPTLVQKVKLAQNRLNRDTVFARPYLGTAKMYPWLLKSHSVESLVACHAAKITQDKGLFAPI
jgi:hypothetical protein